VKVDDVFPDASEHSSVNDWEGAYRIFAEAIASAGGSSPRDTSRLHNEAGFMARCLAIEAFNLGDTDEYQRQLAIAHRHYDAAIAADDTFWRPFFNKANLLARDEERYAEAIPFYDKAASANSGEADIFHNRGIAYASLGKTDSARTDWERALAIDPYHSNARDNLTGLHPHAAP
jgi:tetratricopeptide (TPR) repeat protein